MTRKVYEKPTITTIDSAEILEQIGPAQAFVSGAQPMPYEQIHGSGGGRRSGSAGR